MGCVHVYQWWRLFFNQPIWRPSFLYLDNHICFLYSTLRRRSANSRAGDNQPIFSESRHRWEWEAGSHWVPESSEINRIGCWRPTVQSFLQVSFLILKANLLCLRGSWTMRKNIDIGEMTKARPHATSVYKRAFLQYSMMIIWLR